MFTHVYDHITTRLHINEISSLTQLPHLSAEESQGLDGLHRQHETKGTKDDRTFLNLPIIRTSDKVRYTYEPSQILTFGGDLVFRLLVRLAARIPTRVCKSAGPRAIMAFFLGRNAELETEEHLIRYLIFSWLCCGVDGKRQASISLLH